MFQRKPRTESAAGYVRKGLFRIRFTQEGTVCPLLLLASTLRKLCNRGKLVADKRDGKNQRWGLA